MSFASNMGSSFKTMSAVAIASPSAVCLFFSSIFIFKRSASASRVCVLDWPNIIADNNTVSNTGWLNCRVSDCSLFKKAKSKGVLCAISTAFLQYL